jgi:hypothetical protein
MNEHTYDIPIDIFNNMDSSIEDLRYKVLQLNSTKPSILVHINNYLPTSKIQKTTFTWSKDFENFSVNVKYNHNSNLTKKELLQSISKIFLDLSNEDDEELLKKVKDRPLLKDLLQEYNYPYENIVFGYNYENSLVCDWDLLSKEPQENIYDLPAFIPFEGDLFKGGWCQTSDILNIKVEMMSFLDDVERPKEPKYIAEELWNKIIDANSIIDFSNKCIVYDKLNENGLTISNIINRINRLKIKKMNISNNLLSDEGLQVLVDELVKHNELEELDVSNNMISDIGLRCLKKLSFCKNIKKIIIEGNYGPSEETLYELKELPIQEYMNECDFCEKSVDKLIYCSKCKRKLCVDCKYGDDVTPEGINCCELDKIK